MLGHGHNSGDVHQAEPHARHQAVSQSTHILYIEYHSICLLVGIGTPQPLSRKRVCPSPPEPQGRGAHSPAGGGVPIPYDWRKGLALCLLCAFYQ